MKIKTKSNEEVDISDWVNQIKTNIQKSRSDLFERTPIGKNADGDYFWWEVDDNFINLDKRSVNSMIQKIKEEFKI